MDQKDIAAVLALMRVEGAGNTVARRALTLSQLLGMSVADAIASDPRDLVRQLRATVFDSVLNATRSLNDDAVAQAEHQVARLTQHGVHCFAYTDEEYPELLCRHLDQAPALVWCVGNVELLHDYGAGIVGTRTPSQTGKAIAADCARLFARAEICVVSGGAEGIDTAAHGATLDAGGATVIVLPMGIRRYVFPEYVREAVESNRCALISQFDPEMTWQTHAAVTRNATIAALSKFICVVEPKRMGGSMRTARHAREQDKEVFFYCDRDGGPFARALRQSGAIPLLREDRALDESSLLSSWSKSPTALPEQGELA